MRFLKKLLGAAQALKDAVGTNRDHRCYIREAYQPEIPGESISNIRVRVSLNNRHLSELMALNICNGAMAMLDSYALFGTKVCQLKILPGSSRPVEEPEDCPHRAELFVNEDTLMLEIPLL